MTGTTWVSAFGLSSSVLGRRVGLVVIGGACGSVARYLIALWTAQQFGANFPWGTLLVNVGGSLVIGLLATLADEAGAIGPDTRAMLIVGVLGGFTTFSSFSLDTLRLVERDLLLRAALYVSVSVAVSLIAATAGVALGRVITR